MTAALGFGPLTAADITINTVPLSALVPINNANLVPEGVVQNVASGVTDVIVGRGIGAASTVTVQLLDPYRTLINSGIFDYGDVLSLDSLDFALVQFAKTGAQVQLTFESAVVYNLRKQQGALSWASSSDLDGFVRLLLSAIPGATLVCQPGPVSFDTGSGATASSTVTTVTPIARGTTAEPNEDSWTCINRLADAAGWRCFECEGTIYLGSDAWLMANLPNAGTIQEFTANVLNIDGTKDLGMPLGQLTVTALTELWPYKPGQPITVANLGPLSGQWLIFSMQRDFFNPQATVTLQTPMAPEQVRLGVPTLQYV